MKTRSSWNSSTIAMFLGIDATHGPHQVAQKSSTTTLPSLASSEVSSPIQVSVESSIEGPPSRLDRIFSIPLKNQSAGYSLSAALTRPGKVTINIAATAMHNRRRQQQDRRQQVRKGLRVRTTASIRRAKNGSRVNESGPIIDAPIRRWRPKTARFHVFQPTWRRPRIPRPP